MKKETEYIRRKPIYMGKNSVAIIHIFTRYDHLEDIGIFTDTDQYYKKELKVKNEAAKQFISQLQNHWSVNFMKQLRDEIDILIKKCENKK